MRVALLLGPLLLAGCGHGGAPTASPGESVDPLADAEVTVSGSPDSDVCLSASVPGLDASFDRRCFSPPHLHIIDVASARLVETDDPGINSLTLLVSPHPVVVTGVTQGGQEVRWRQVGGGLLVLGLSLLAAPTSVEFELAGDEGVCEFRPDGESCRVG